MKTVNDLINKLEKLDKELPILALDESGGMMYLNFTGGFPHISKWTGEQLRDWVGSNDMIDDDDLPEWAWSYEGDLYVIQPFGNY